ncbi:MAG: glycosyltransferase family 2 protein [Phycisphaerae bacterium]|nr:glycosyltransferase family 2 protein [Phycisphaerae bacterium]
MPTLFVVIPFYNEPSTLDECLRRVQDSPLPRGWSRDLTLINDGSRPEAAAAARDICAARKVRFLEHQVNRGKGAAIRTGFDDVLARANDADAVIIQDADLEYDPRDFGPLLAALLDDGVDAVFGNRWGSNGDPRMHRRLHRAMNRALTIASNALSGLHISDMECCYKLFRVPTLRAIVPSLTEERFGIEPQIAAALGRIGAAVKEAPVTYAPRSFSEGKKIRPRDGLRALWVIARERGRRGGSP